MIDRYDLLDAMVNYEAMLIEADQALTAQGREPLYAIYPIDGLTIADSPLAFVNKGGDSNQAVFKKLQQYFSRPKSSDRSKPKAAALAWLA